MVKRVPPKFASSDGREFDTEPEAQRHEELIMTKRTYEDARSAYAQALWETQRTADDEPFEFGVWQEYYQIVNWTGWPMIRKVDFYVHNCHLDERDETCITEYRHDGGRVEYRTYRISELYASKRNAKAALVKAQEEHLKERRAEMQKLKAELAK